MTTWLVMFFRKLGVAAVAPPYTLVDRWADVTRLNTDPLGRITASVAANRSELQADNGRIE